MEKNTPDRIKYYLKVGIDYKEELARIRHWNNLKIGTDGDVIWVKNFDYLQINSLEAKSIPFNTAYYEKNSKLYLLNHSLPECHVPSVLWTDIDRGLPVTLPSLNHNLFGIDERIGINLVASNIETDAVASVAALPDLSQYINSGPSIRIERMRWMLLSRKALLIGTPLLPIPGNTFWARKDHLLPTGFDFELYILSDLIQRKLNPGRDHYILWSTDGSYALLPKANLTKLSRSSFRLTLIDLNVTDR